MPNQVSGRRRHVHTRYTIADGSRLRQAPIFPLGAPPAPLDGDSDCPESCAHQMPPTGSSEIRNVQIQRPRLRSLPSIEPLQNRSCVRFSARALRFRFRPGYLVWLPVIPAAVYLLRLAGHFTRLTSDQLWNADASSPMSLADSIATQPHGHVIFNQYIYLAFDVVTRPLPLHHELWILAPALLALTCVALMAVASWRVAGIWAGAVTAAIAICASPIVLATELVQGDHGGAWANTALLGVFLVLVAERVKERISRRLVIGAVAVAVVTGVDAASDNLVYFTALLPLAGAVLLYGYRRLDGWSARLALVGLGTCGLAAAAAVATQAVAAHAGISQSYPLGPKGAHFVASSDVPGRVGTLARFALSLSHGAFLGNRIDVGSVFQCLLGVAGLAALLVAVTQLRSRVSDQVGGEPHSLRGLHSIYWALSALVVGAAFVFTELPAVERYTPPLFFTVAAVIPVWATTVRARQWLVACGAAVFGVAGIVTVADSTPQGESADSLPAVIAFLKSHHLTAGYAWYWDASPITWKSGGEITAYPIWDICPSAPGKLCPPAINSSSAWYRDQGRGEMFVLVDPNFSRTATAQLTTFGQPRARYAVGGMTVLVYDGDLAARLAPTPELVP